MNQLISLGWGIGNGLKIGHRNGNHIQTLIDHLQGVSKLCGEFSGVFGYKDYGEIIGLQHDFGKYNPNFQNYINGLVKKGPDTWHSISGAILSSNLSNHFVGSYIIAGHHGGLPNWNPINALSGLKNKLKDKHNQSLFTLSDQQALSTTKIPLNKTPIFHKTLYHLWIRMLFSCLVDADFLDTEQFMNKNNSNLRENYKSIKELAKTFFSYMNNKIKSAPQNNINKIRKKIYQDCLKAAAKNEQLFSLTVPTGGGKTLSSMAFALNYAIKNNKDRIIIVIPYTSIIEQTADVLKEILGDENVVEHHCNFDIDNITNEKIKDKIKLYTENWDAPVIVTTSVQFFESIFSNKTQKCRKLHNITNSVVVIDEVQMIPDHVLKPIIVSIKGLKDKFKTSFVLSSATQPAFTGMVSTNSQNVLTGFKKITEIISDVNYLFNNLKRTKLYYLGNKITQDITNDLMKYKQVLCILNTRKSAYEIYSLLPANTVHLSTIMCPAHRSDKIKEIKQKLLNGEEIRVVSTQLIEAGVDVDFPVVYRALAGFDSIAQSAGRCNREGKQSIGDVYVFNLNEFVDPKIRTGRYKTLDLIRNNLFDIQPDNFLIYFRRYYNSVNNFDINDVMTKLTPTNEITCEGINFEESAQAFKMINDVKNSLIITYGNCDNVVELIKKYGPTKELTRKIQKYSVSIKDKEYNILQGLNKIDQIIGPDGPTQLFVLNDMNKYDDAGLKMF